MKNFIIIILFISGCQSQKVLSEKMTVRDTVIYTEVEKEIQVPAFNIESFKINIDSLKTLLGSGVSREIIEKTLVREDPETQIKVGILIDSLGNLMAVCEAQDRLIKVLIEEREILTTEIRTVIVEEKENFLKMIWESVKILFIGLIVLIIAISVFRLLK